jgi:hypothetical protein
MERYFIKVDNDNEPVAAYRLIDMPDVYAEELWLNGEWTPTTRLVKYLIDGEASLDEVTKEEADAFIATLPTTQA